MKILGLGIFLMFFFGVGAALVINPDPLIKNSGASKGGQMLTAWNRLGFRITGIMFAGFAIYGIYELWLNH